MARKTLFVSLVLLLSFFVINFASISILDAKAAAPAGQSLGQADSSELSCLNPTAYDQRVICSHIEEQILAVTVRIELHTWATFGGYHKPITTNSHATILDGKYLVTHNHYKYDLTEQVVEFGELKGYTGVSIRTTSGRLLLDNAPLASFTVVHQDPETLVLAFVDEKGKGLFETYGLPSAQFSDWQSVAWQPGMELAQIDWNGNTAHVDWVLVEDISLAGDVPQVQVNNFPKIGCSGGGVFWNTIHIGNNWARNFQEDSNTGEVVRRYSIIALNSETITDLE